MVDVVGRQPLDPEQMAVRERGPGGTFVHEPRTIGGTFPPCKEGRGSRLLSGISGWYCYCDSALPRPNSVSRDPPFPMTS
jgi:hypothetical protein